MWGGSSLLTVFLGIGMTLGPALGGYLIKISGALSHALLLGMVAYSGACIIAIALKPR